MGRREFFAWVDLAFEDMHGTKADDPHSWEGTENDEWWARARQRRSDERGW